MQYQLNFLHFNVSIVCSRNKLNKARYKENSRRVRIPVSSTYLLHNSNRIKTEGGRAFLLALAWCAWWDPTMTSSTPPVAPPNPARTSNNKYVDPGCKTLCFTIWTSFLHFCLQLSNTRAVFQETSRTQMPFHFHQKEILHFHIQSINWAKAPSEPSGSNKTNTL